jgi:hypothetical protein
MAARLLEISRSIAAAVAAVRGRSPLAGAQDRTTHDSRGRPPDRSTLG